jgi:RNA polymerase-binding transcription factor DksA
MEVIMSANSTTCAIDNAAEQNGGVVWNRLHSEREDICEALLREPVSGNVTNTIPERIANEDAVRITNWHRELLQARLRKIDDALDRLMSGSYGNCCNCGKWIEDTKLEFDPAIAFCLGCWELEQRRAGIERLSDGSQAQAHSSEIDSSRSSVALQTLAPFDTIWVQTRNSDYRIFLLDPTTGRALVEGGFHFVEPVEAMVSGSTSRDSNFKNAEIAIGLRIEMWVNGKLVSTSPVQSVRVEHCDSGELASARVPKVEM